MERDRGAYQRFVAAALLDDDAPALVTVPNIEILEVGEDWETSTGLFTWDYADLQSAIASQDDPAVRTPVVKLGHTDVRFFDGQPAFGRVVNLRLSENGQTLLCDLAGVPKWLAACMPTAYPRRSIEGYFDQTTRTGNTWPFVLTALALLGDAYPAINTLEDLQVLWGEQAPELVPVEDHPVVVASGPLVRATRTEDGMATWKQGGPAASEGATVPGVRAAVSVSQLTRSYYDTLTDAQWWWWIREVRIDPAELIVDDDDGNLFRVPYAIEGDTVVFGEEVEVVIEYVDVAAAAGQPPVKTPTAPLAQGQRPMATWVDPQAAGRPDRGEKPASVAAAESGATVPTDANQEVPAVKLSADALSKLGLSADATDDEVNAAILAMQASDTPDDGNTQSQPQTPSGDPAAQPATTPNPDAPAPTPAVPPADAPATTETGGLQIPEGMKLVDDAQWAEIQRQLGEAGELVTASKAKVKQDLLEGAVRAGKFPRSRMDHYGALYDLDPQGTQEAIAKLADGVIPVRERGADETEGDQVAAAAYPETWKQTVQATQRAVGTGRVKVGAD